MKHLKRIFFSFETMFFSFLVFYAGVAFAQSVISPQDFFAQVLQFIQSWGGIPMVLKVAGIITLLISSMKVSALNQLLWDKLGVWQAWVAPILGLIAGILGLGQNGPITPSSVFAYVTAGAGAIILHELLDAIKTLPGIGFLWTGIINLIEHLLGGPSSPRPSAVAYRKAKAEKLGKMAYELRTKK